MELKEAVAYDSETGLFHWLITTGRVKAGSIAGSKNHDGYVRINVLGKNYAAHRLAWYFITGEFPESDLDHINRVRDDNRQCNLRLATKVLNAVNRSKLKNNKSGVTGVVHRGDRYMAQIKIAGKCIFLGVHDTIDAARDAYLDAKTKRDLTLFGEAI